jgi:hypothetical protein
MEHASIVKRGRDAADDDDLPSCINPESKIVFILLSRCLQVTTISFVRARCNCLLIDRLLK